MILERLIKNLVTILGRALLLFWIALIFWAYHFSSHQKLTDVLFWAGLCPIIIFTVGIVAGIIGVGGFASTYNNQNISGLTSQLAIQDVGAERRYIRADIHWVSAGILCWILCLII